LIYYCTSIIRVDKLLYRICLCNKRKYRRLQDIPEAVELRSLERKNERHKKVLNEKIKETVRQG